MTYAVKVTISSHGTELVHYVGRRGECKRNAFKVEGWKKLSSAEQWISEQAQKLNRDYEINYQIVTLSGGWNE